MRPSPPDEASSGAARRAFTRERAQAISAGLGALGEDDLRRADARARHRLGADLGRPRGVLDPLPLSIDPETWAVVSSGVAERIELFERIAADVYGPRALLEEGLLPAEVVWGDAGLVRAALGHRPPSGHWLVHATVDVAFEADGDGRSEGPGRPVAVGLDIAGLGGLGRAHENRLATAELLPGLFTRARVQRLVPFLDRLRSRLGELAGLAGPAMPSASAVPGRPTPSGPGPGLAAGLAAGLGVTPGPAPGQGQGPVRVVILSSPRSARAPGAGHAEAAYLARTLGYTLVEGSDLTVRRGDVFLRSLAGLEPVHAVLRLLPDGLCDPLDLEPRSGQGTPGLLASSLRGRVALANPLGAGWLANPALEAFLPAVAKALSGGELRLPGPPTWWCGAPEGRRRALDRLGEIVLAGVAGDQTLDTRRMTADDLALTRARVEAEPRGWVAIEPVAPRPVPAFADGRLQRSPTVTRVFGLVEASGVVVAAGGLTQVLDNDFAVGGGAATAPGPNVATKDTWVLAADRRRQAPRTRPVGLDQVDFADSLPSRAGESLYWLGRYAERAEAVVRLAQVVAALGRDLEEEPAWVTRMVAALDRLSAGAGSEARPERSARQAAAAALVDEDLAFGLRAARRRLADSAAAVSDLVSPELLQAVQDSAGAADSLDGTSSADARETLDRLLGALAAVAGLAQETMVRGPGWLLLDAGRRVERGTALLSVLRSTLLDFPSGEPQLRPSQPRHHVSAELLEAVLAQSASLIAYRRRYRSDPELSAVVELLLLDAGNPRSLRFQLDALAYDLGHLPEGGRPAARRAVAATAAALADRVGTADPGALVRRGPDGSTPALAELIQSTVDGLSGLARSINLEYIAQVIAAPLPTDTGGTEEQAGVDAEGEKVGHTTAVGVGVVGGGVVGDSEPGAGVVGDGVVGDSEPGAGVVGDGVTG